MTPEQFEKFKHNAVHESMRRNELCHQQFRILEWPRWDYELGEGTLTFSKDGKPRVVADIVVAGTTSKSGGTWLWSWANKHLPALVTHPLNRVREFGENEGIEQLSKDLHPDDEYLGWEMTSIAVQLLNGKGSYRCPTENGFVYLVYLELYHAEQAPDRKQVHRIGCDRHPLAYSTYVCKHLIADPKQQWFSDQPTEGDRWPEAWCAACDKTYAHEGEWRDENGKLVIQLLCHECYEHLRGWRRPQ